MRTGTIIIAVLLLTSLTGCNVVYKLNVQQGNVLEQKQVDELRPGMSKRQVSLILGTPAIHSPFHRDRWDYVAAFRRRGELAERKLLSLTFENDRLVKIEGDYKPEDAEVVDGEQPTTDEA